jgi:hypothetical protein
LSTPRAWLARGAAGRGALAALALAGALAAAPAQAHKPSDSYLSITAPPPVQGAPAGYTLSGRWDIALRDLDFAIGLDADGDGEITWGETRRRHADIAAYATARLAVRADGAPCSVSVGPQAVDEHTDGAYTVMPLQWVCPAAPQRIEIDYRLFADIDPQHRGLLNLTAAGASRTAVLGPQAPSQAFELAEVRPWRQFLSYAREGVWHIWVGFDHILFLLSLLLPSVMAWQALYRGGGHARGRARGRWAPVGRFAPAFWDVLRIVTAFTLAHSITLSLATLGLVTLPTRVVESAIAASVVLAALNNVWPLFQGRRWAVAFGFGLIHGFGFASVLADLGLPQGALALALLGFNLGVELGQLAIVAAFLPLAYALRRTAFYRGAVLWAGSLLIAALAAVWLAERLFNLKVLPF